ncbi:MAG: helix-turn-helix domain-containing protein, partial [Candidatus Nanopelagicales bacterium]
SCRSCGQSLAPWGWARTRSVAGPGATTVRVRPRRARCRGCRTTEVLLPAQALPRCGAGVELVGQVLMAAAQGTGHRAIAASLDLPTDTLRRWLRRARANAYQLCEMATMRAHQFDPDPPPPQPQPTALAQAVDALAVAAAAAARIVGPVRSPWLVISVLTGGRLLAAPPRPN